MRSLGEQEKPPHHDDVCPVTLVSRYRQRPNQAVCVL